MKQNYWVPAIIFSIFILLTGFCGCGERTGKQPVQSNRIQENGIGLNSGTEKKLQLHFLDVGQADSTLVIFPDGETMLVDGGNEEDADTIIQYLKDRNIHRIDYLVGTHPHEDHIGGLDEVVLAFPVKKVFLPGVTTTTESFEDLLLALSRKHLKANRAIAGTVIENQDGVEAVILSPQKKDYSNLNDWSVVIRIKYKNNAFLLTGDADSEVENELISSGDELAADVLKVGHHGSRESTSSQFLEEVNPKYAVIEVGSGNDYGHPHPETLARLKANNVTVYRTDRDKTIIMTSDGSKIKVIGPAVPRSQKREAKSQLTGYIGNRNSKKFHLPSCQSLPAPKNRVYFKTREEAVEAGYSPCGRCCGN
ncbi:MAG: MBL fold metallo-hydrolase [Chitinophagales bacterium]